MSDGSELDMFSFVVFAVPFERVDCLRDSCTGGWTGIWFPYTFNIKHVSVVPPATGGEVCACVG